MRIEDKVFSYWRLGYKLPKMSEQLKLPEKEVLAVFTKVLDNYFSVL